MIIADELIPHHNRVELTHMPPQVRGELGVDRGLCVQKHKSLLRYSKLYWWISMGCIS